MKIVFALTLTLLAVIIAAPAQTQTIVGQHTETYLMTASSTSAGMPRVDHGRWEINVQGSSVHIIVPTKTGQICYALTGCKYLDKDTLMGQDVFECKEGLFSNGEIPYLFINYDPDLNDFVMKIFFYDANRGIR